jgi:hypothetical protein
LGAERWPPLGARERRFTIGTHVAANQRTDCNADSGTRQIANDARAAFDEQRFVATQIALHCAGDRQLCAGDVSAHHGFFTEHDVSCDGHIALDSSVNLEAAVAAHIAADDGATTYD